MRKLLLFCALSLGFVCIKGQTSALNGVWLLDNVSIKEVNSNNQIKTVAPESLSNKFLFDCPAEINIRSEQVSATLRDGTRFDGITFILKGDTLQMSIIPSKKSIYKINTDNNRLELQQNIDAATYTYIYMPKNE